MGISSSVPPRNKPKPSRLGASRGRTINFEFSRKGKTDANKAVVGESLEYLDENERLINGYSGPAEEVRVADPDEIVVLVIWPDWGLCIGRTGPIPEHFFRASDQ